MIRNEIAIFKPIQNIAKASKLLLPMPTSLYFKSCIIFSNITTAQAKKCLGHDRIFNSISTANLIYRHQRFEKLTFIPFSFYSSQVNPEIFSMNVREFKIKKLCPLFLQVNMVGNLRYWVSEKFGPRLLWSVIY